MSDPDELNVHYTDPLNPDTDGDGLLDGSDPDFIQDAMTDLPAGSFTNKGQSNALQNRFDLVEAYLLAGRTQDALNELSHVPKVLHMFCLSVEFYQLFWFFSCFLNRV